MRSLYLCRKSDLHLRGLDGLANDEFQAFEQESSEGV